MIGSLLIANRGEIALRIIRTCRRLGIRTIAVYSDADRDSPHVKAADTAVRLGPAAARESYLRLDAIIEAAKRSGAQAIHPGYGFLSEKPVLAEACARAGIVFVGPSADRIAAMGAKIGAKIIAKRAGVRSVPGYFGEDQSDERLIEEAKRIGFPVMVKASAGGGGKGMRRVFAENELTEALSLARKEAEAAFGDPSLLIEKLVLRPRHLEVQIAGDKFGNIVHLYERDCSVQRNNQKVLEEAPAPNLDAGIRQKLLECGIALAQTIAYDNLGTVEFILEEGQNEPWFLEMNTRLQVEHPVTEAITGLDLVEWQIRIASGEALPLKQDEIQARGHAIEARITAERAEKNFMPDTGHILVYREPGSIRIDSGVAQGTEVTLHYDSLLAKAIAHDATRDGARRKLIAGLGDFALLGPSTTLPFLVDALAHPLFAEGRATTRFIEEAFPNGWVPAKPAKRYARAMAAILTILWSKQPERVTPPSAWTHLRGFRVLAPAGGVARAHFVVGDDEGTSTMTVTALAGNGWHIGDQDGEFDLNLSLDGNSVELDCDGATTAGFFACHGGNVFLTWNGEAHRFTVSSQVRVAAAAAGTASGSGAVLSTMPGVVAEIKVTRGEHVEAGQVVAILESMKLFLPLTAGFAGTVTEIACQVGETVSAAKLLVAIEPEA
jgi:3-methylcrotonyl-CoA carboxylase alpha subunit